MSGGVVAANVPLHTMVPLFTRVAGAETFEYSSPALASTSIFTLASVPTKFSARTVQSVWLVVAKVVGVQSCVSVTCPWRLLNATGMTTGL